MDRQIELLRFLRRKDGGLNFHNINKKMSQIGLKDENHISEFIGYLLGKGHIKYRNDILSVSDGGAGFLAVKGAEDVHMAKITPAGIDYLKDETLKKYNKNVATISVIITIFFGIITAWLTYTSNQKDVEITVLKNISDKKDAEILNLKNASITQNTQIQRLTKALVLKKTDNGHDLHSIIRGQWRVEKNDSIK